MDRKYWREYTIGIFLLLAGLVYLSLQLLAFFRGDHSAIGSDNNTIRINRYAFLNELRTYVTIACCIFGGWLLMRGRKAGWLLALPMILLFTAIVLAGTLSLLQMKIFDASFYLVIAGAAIILFLLIALLSLHYRYITKKDDWIVAILLCTGLGLFYFLLQ